ncbi:SDR family NAD(P)-dependent oxidoreductase [Streptomyces sp. TRM 70351]|uniref:SDR family NAD(P)-dependent oxidoreductase n=1 Tax=Streptomyces sp. TRM 70351 TaxID=3116552 RepID=UPI002E7B4FA4|nr:SDR family NAD(P)-dependent oxidoreductase [Streptomyces sp. TRM 70351]MEE1928570.1 SDR family NAD(P)-dependent oxidoreductase [Streptomyces sp. TRM 70351]
MLPLQGRTAIVTGAGRGIGRAEALHLARLGAFVVVNDSGVAASDGSGPCSGQPAEAVVAEIRAAGGVAVAHAGDVGEQTEARDVVRLAVERFGGLDILVNNAGIMRDRMVYSMSEDEWDSVVRVNLKAQYNTTKYASAYWRQQAKESGYPVYGRIVNTSTEAFLAGSPLQPNQAAAGGGVIGLTTSSALALAAYGVTVNAVCPRARTRMTEECFAGVLPPAHGGVDPLTTEHVAPLVGYLVSPAAARVTGQVMVVHGGMVAVLDRPRVAATFDTAGDVFTHEELEDQLTPYFTERTGEGFAALEVVSLRKR